MEPEQPALALPPVKPTAAHVRHGLSLRYAETHALLFEVANATGAGANRHIDALALGLWPSRGMEIEGIEIKVSRSDWKRELADHAKADAIQRFCDRWWIAAPKGLIPPAELPPTWGLLELVEGDTMRVKVQAPKLDAIPLTRGFVAAVARRAARDDSDERRLWLEKALEPIKKSLREEANQRVSYRAKEAEKAMERVQAIKEATGIDLCSYQADARFIAAVRFALATPLLQQEFYHQGLLELSKDLDRTAGEVRKLNDLLNPGAGGTAG